jgi:alkylation response protein AidB-like acyl-CoA dehydrogenase
LSNTSPEALRAEIRDWLDRELPRDHRTCLGMAGGYSPEFSRRLGQAGWLGLSVPLEYGGHGGTAVQRFVVTEELLAAQAPVGAHWLADRQVAPSILAVGTEEQRHEFLPRIVRGECYFSIGLSEPDAGSDLSAVRTRAFRTQQGWRVSGAKIWTTFAQHNHHLLTLCRTEPRGENRHAGLSQLIVDLKADGVQVRPIRTMDGGEEFCEVILDDVFVPEDRLLGVQGDGWRQAGAELALERYGPERWLSVWGCLTGFVSHVVGDPTGRSSSERVEIGRLAAKYRIVRSVSLNVAKKIDGGHTPTVESAVAKDLATALEQETVEVVRRLRGGELTYPSADAVESMLGRAVLTSPTFTIRGGTTEVLRGVIARDNSKTAVASETSQAVADLLARSVPDPWLAFVEAGLPWAAVPPERDGPGGSVRDATDIIRVVGHEAAAVPAGETDLLGDWLLRRAGLPPSPPELIAVAPGTAADDLRLERRGDAVVLTGTAHRVAWASSSGRFVALVPAAGQHHVVSVPIEQLAISARTSLAGESRDSVTANAIQLKPDQMGRVPRLCRLEFRARGAATRAVLIHGAVEAVSDLVGTYCATRQQFGRRLRDFQVVSHQLALLREYTTLVAAAGDLAIALLDGSASWEEAAVAKIVAGEVASQVAKVAHQLHGAIGVSEEYALHGLTRRLWSWRDEYGGEHEWSAQLGETLVSRNSDALWLWLTQTRWR